MSCDATKFTITRGFDNTFVFTIKANGSTLPLIIEGSDTFSATLIDLDTDTPQVTKPMIVTNAIAGQVTLSFTSEETSALVKDRGDKVDRYYLRPVYKLLIECDTQNNGKFIAKVAEIYVD